jgi:uncharacterized Rmd1/YagE family protein
MYHLPLLPGYDPSVNVRSSAPSKTPGGKSFLTALSEAEENGYEGTYFPSENANEPFTSDGFIPSSSPEEPRISDTAGGANQDTSKQRPRARSIPDERVAEVIFFAYGVVVFYGLQETQEKDIIDDLNSAGILVRRVEEDLWEVEECHYTVRLWPDLYGHI